MTTTKTDYYVERRDFAGTHSARNSNARGEISGKNTHVLRVHHYFSFLHAPQQIESRSSREPARGRYYPWTDNAMSLPFGKVGLLLYFEKEWTLTRIYCTIKVFYSVCCTFFTISLFQLKYKVVHVPLQDAFFFRISLTSHFDRKVLVCWNTTVQPPFQTFRPQPLSIMGELASLLEAYKVYKGLPCWNSHYHIYKSCKQIL